MADADDFDIEGLRALLRGDAPAPPVKPLAPARSAKKAPPAKPARRSAAAKPAPKTASRTRSKP